MDTVYIQFTNGVVEMQQRVSHVRFDKARLVLLYASGKEQSYAVEIIKEFSIA